MSFVAVDASLLVLGANIVVNPDDSAVTESAVFGSVVVVVCVVDLVV